MVISDKEAYRVLGLPLGVDRDAIRERYKTLSIKLSASKSPEDRRKLEQVVSAYTQLIPQPQKQLPIQNNIAGKNKAPPKIARHSYFVEENSSSEDDMKGRNGDIKSNIDKDKKKSEKKKAKKKKRKEKKKQERMENDSHDRRNDDSDSDSDGEIVEDVQGIDPNSAFVAMVGKKIGSNGVNPNINNANSSITIRPEDSKKVKNENKSIVMLEVRQVQARQLAMRGNEEANKGEYERAVRLFAEAIRFDPNDHRFFGNRSYCYDQLRQFDKALKDADKAISLAPEWPKGHFRKGRALKGLGKLLEAESSFEEVLKFDPGCEDAIQEINKVRKRKIVEMGFTELQAKAAIKKYSQVQPALDALLTGEFQESLENIFFSDEEEDEEDFEAEATWQPPPQPKDVKMNPKNPEGLTSLWVGNVVPDVTEKKLTKLFSKYGVVTSVRQLKEKYCAFVNFSDKGAAGRAMEGLQGHEISGSRLLIKFPDNPIVNGTQNIIIRKNKNTKTTSSTTPSTVQPTTPVWNTPPETNSTSNHTIINDPKAKGPVNGDECYFWRTTGCAFKDSCKYKHIPRNKGIDKKPWQK